VKPDCRPKHKGCRAETLSSRAATPGECVAAHLAAHAGRHAGHPQAIVRPRRNLVGSTTPYSSGHEDLQRWATTDNKKVGCLLRRTVTPMTVAHHLVYGVDLRSVGNIPRTGPSPGRN
jgi:hypothetical protein